MTDSPDVTVLGKAVMVVTTGVVVDVVVTEAVTVTGGMLVERYDEQYDEASAVLVAGDTARKARRQLSALHTVPARSKSSRPGWARQVPIALIPNRNLHPSCIVAVYQEYSV